MASAVKSISVFFTVLSDEKVYLDPLDSSPPKDPTGDRTLPHQKSEL